MSAKNKTRTASAKGAAPGPQFVDSVQEISEWLTALGPVENADSKIEVHGIKQRLYELRDPRTDPERFGRLLSECNRWRHNIEMRRKVMPIALHGEKFPSKRRKGAVGRLHRLIAKALATDPALKARRLWETLSDDARLRNLSWEFIGDQKVIDPKGHATSYRQFCNLVSEIRNLPK